MNDSIIDCGFTVEKLTIFEYVTYVDIDCWLQNDVEELPIFKYVT